MQHQYCYSLHVDFDLLTKKGFIKMLAVIVQVQAKMFAKRPVNAKTGASTGRLVSGTTIDELSRMVKRNGVHVAGKRFMKDWADKINGAGFRIPEQGARAPGHLAPQDLG
jgi:hypothetical protein